MVGTLQRQLTWLAAKTDVDAWAIDTVFRDVATYLENRLVREEVLDCVRKTMPTSGEVVLVSHSLGTVVAMDLLTEPAEVKVVHLVTAGSPLGLDSVFNRLLTGGPRLPPKVGDWLNAWCPTDAVALGCPLSDDWRDGLTEVAVLNARDRVHKIEEYLSHAEVAQPIGARLTG